MNLLTLLIIGAMTVLNASADSALHAKTQNAEQNSIDSVTIFAKLLDLSSDHTSMRRSLVVDTRLPDGFRIYKEGWSVTVDGQEVQSVDSPLGDPDSETFPEKSFSLLYSFQGSNDAYSVAVSYSGCSATECFMPQTKHFRLTLTNGADITGIKFDSPPRDTNVASFRSADGFISNDEFLRFLRADTTMQNSFSPPESPFRRLLLFFLFVLSGFALNFTPCVLPMIPVQLAILGIGGQRTTKREGLRKGMLYGAGMAFAYGALGAALVLTGGVFGALQSSPYFNGAIALIFILLALSLTDLFVIDFSRFGRLSHSLASSLAVFGMGCTTALLAGACVAPAVISAFLIAGGIYADGIDAALAYPLALGIGMAAPWPLIGAGVAAMPKPGAWMKYVKIGFAIVILAFAVRHAKLAINGFAHAADNLSGALSAQHAEELITKAKTQGKPILLDFWATWCKNCSAMEKSVMRHPKVLDELKNFTVIRIQAENPNDNATATLLKKYDVRGLPAFRILESPKTK